MSLVDVFAAHAAALAQAHLDRLETDCERALHLTDPERWGGLHIVQAPPSLNARHADVVGWIASAWPNERWLHAHRPGPSLDPT